MDNRSCRFLISLLFSLAIASTSLALNAELNQKRIIVSRAEPSKDAKSLLKTTDDSKVFALAKKEGFEVVSLGKWCFFVSTDVLPDKLKIATRQKFLDSLLNGGALDGPCLDFSKLEPALAQSLRDTLCNTSASLSQIQSPGQMRGLVQCFTPVRLSNGGKTVQFTAGMNNKRSDEDKVVMNIDPSYDASQYKQQKDLFYPRSANTGTYTLTYGMGLGEDQQYEASLEIFGWLRKTRSEAVKGLLDSYGFVLNKLLERSGLGNQEPEGTYDKLSASEKAELRSKLIGSMGTFGFKDEHEVDNFLNGASYSRGNSSLYLATVTQDAKTGQRSILSIQIAIPMIY